MAATVNVVKRRSPLFNCFIEMQRLQNGRWTEEEDHINASKALVGSCMGNWK